jgi:hypothetical protein
MKYACSHKPLFSRNRWMKILMLLPPRRCHGSTKAAMFPSGPQKGSPHQRSDIFTILEVNAPDRQRLIVTEGSRHILD